MTILRAGMFATLQDSGRAGFRQYGVPSSGAADVLSCQLANILVGNARDEAVLEVSPGGFSVQFESDALIALAGASVVAIASEALNDAANNAASGKETDNVSGKMSAAYVQNYPLPTNRPVLVRAGSVLTITSFVAGWRVYLAVAGGISVPAVMNSRSTYLYGRFGGLDGRLLKKGDTLESGVKSATAARLTSFLAVQAARSKVRTNRSTVSTNQSSAWHSRIGYSTDWFASSVAFRTYNSQANPKAHPKAAAPCVLRVVRGSNIEEFTEPSKYALFTQSFRVTQQADRMGLRLEPPAASVRLERYAARELISSAVLPGLVQVPPQGTPIILLSDAQTMGGYPVIACVCSVDVARAAQLAPGDEVLFQEISLDAAWQLMQSQQYDLTMLQTAIEAKVAAFF